MKKLTQTCKGGLKKIIVLHLVFDISITDFKIVISFITIIRQFYMFYNVINTIKIIFTLMT